MQPEKTAFIFPGQGSQQSGMGSALAQAYPLAREIFERADQILEYPLSRLAWEGPNETLDDTVHTQPALLVHSVAALQVLQHHFPGFQPACVAGHSMGELSALVAAGSLGFEDALRLVQQRGQLMKRAGQLEPGGMAAVLGLDIPILEEICSQASQGGSLVQVANDNCPGQVVISGHANALESAMELAVSAGARKVIRLAVSIAAHSPLMATAQQDFNRAVEQAPIRDPHLPIIANVSALSMHTAAEIRADLQDQLRSRVRWTETIQHMLAAGIDTFVEIGSGEVLSGLVKRIDRRLTRIALGKPEDFGHLLTGA